MIFRSTPGLILIGISVLGQVGVFRFCRFLIIASVVLVAHNFTQLHSGWVDCGYLAFGELWRFVYCLLQKIKRSSDLPVIECGKHTCSQIIRALEPSRKKISWKEPVCYRRSKKRNSSFLRKKILKDRRHILEDFVSTIVFTVAVDSLNGQDLRYFCAKMVIRSDDS